MIKFEKLIYTIINYSLVNQISQLNKSHIDEIVVLGNGPSALKDIERHVEFLQGRSLFCVNNFVGTKYYEKLKPDFYAINDALYWEEKINEGSDTAGLKDNILTVLHGNVKRYNKELIKKRNEFFESLNDKTNWPVTLFVPAYAKQAIKERITNKMIQVAYLSAIPKNFKTQWLRNILYKTGLAMPVPQTVLIYAIYISLKLRFKRIYLIGADHSWHEDIYLKDDNSLWMKNTSLNEDNHYPLMMDPIRGVGTRMQDQFYAMYLAFQGHSILNELAKTSNASIVNMSSKTWIDSYPRFYP